MVICIKRTLAHFTRDIALRWLYSFWLKKSPLWGSFNKRLQGRGDKGSCPDVITHLASLPQTGGGPAWLPHKLFGKHSRANISHHHHQYLSLSSSIFVTIIINIFYLHHQYFSPSSSIFFTLVINICHKHHKKIQLKSIQMHHTIYRNSDRVLERLSSTQWEATLGAQRVTSIHPFTSQL